MNNLIDIENFREENRKKVEEKAYELYGIVKTKEDYYIYPEVMFMSNSAELKLFFNEELNGMSVEKLHEKEAIDAINSIVPMKGQSIKIMLFNTEEDGMLTFDIFNLTTSKNVFITTPMEDCEEHRKIFTAIIAGAIKKMEVDVTFLVQLNYNGVERMVKSV